MRLATIDSSGTPRLVAVVGNDDGAQLAVRAFRDFEGDLVDLIAAYPDPRRLPAPAAREERVDRSRLLAPIPHPRRNLFCVGKNYHDHAREFQRSGFDGTKEDRSPLPSFFTKPGTCVVGPDAPVLAHCGVTRQMDYENELAVIIGRGGRGIRRADATEHVFGYTIVNDVTARDLQRDARQWFLGKALDTFCPMGPWVVTADEIDVAGLELRTWINGELRQQASTQQLIFDIPQLVEVLSAGMTLHPGDVIATGTPAGVGIGFDPPRFLQPGDVMKLEISGIGNLTNTVEGNAR